ncbi:MAG: N-acetylmuramic acid 6-phosphate etherase [Candidatus Zixiibacteriota bacterium]|nr:MAG: N-acetylmuramic acid 6-phosphate etherase [candidate division Zixibacteria bacterium]
MKNRSGKNKNRSAPRGRDVFDELSGLLTESLNPSSKNIDRLSTRSILRLINKEDRIVADAVAHEIKYIGRAVDMVVEAFRSGGRLFYIGAGTSGRLGVLDAAECPPTFGTDPELIQGIISGGSPSLIRSREGVEDDIEAAVKEVKRRKIGKRDVAIGITASKRTPFVLEGLRIAKKRGAKTVFVSCNPREIAPKDFDLNICLVVGPEIIAGSSRMKAGTAQKMTLNMISTAAMIRTGRVYGNRMVDLMATSEKLRERSKKILMDVCGLEYDSAGELLEKAGRSVKLAIIMSKTGLSRAESGKLIKSSDGLIYKALRKSAKRAE